MRAPRAMWNTLVDSLVYFPDRELYGDPSDVGLAFTDLTIPTEDGERLHAWWIPTRAAPARGHVLFFHGNAGNVSHRVEHALALSAAGLDLLLVDYRGLRPEHRPSERGGPASRCARQPGRPERRGSRGPAAASSTWGSRWGRRSPFASPSRMPPLACVLQSAFTSLRDVAREHYPARPGRLAGDAYPSLERIRRRAPRS